MFRCNDCENEFYEPEIIKEYRGQFWGMPAYEDVYCCPFCQSDDYEEVIDEY